MDKNYEEIDFMCGNTIESCVLELLYYKEKGKLVYGVFNGHKLYSHTVTMDNAYKEITGNTKKEFDDYLKKQSEEYEKQKQEHLESIPFKTSLWVKKGREILEESKWELWEKIVPIRLNDLYQGMELEQCLDVVKLLKKDGKFNEAKELIYNQGHSGMSFGLICSMIKEFSPIGEEFVKFIK